MLTLITGGARSGKSAYAERRCLALSGVPQYIATAEAGDAEMAARIAAHRARRGPPWQDLEAPLDLVGALDRTDGRGPRLVDCLTLWLSNLMFAGRDWRAEAEALCVALARQTSPVIFVSNEVG
ncbi:bifunctional adenosylcobinamide kinase/adenosylcobinamide-phosphate guanylyltransferase, partial [Thioclava sp. BHET1]